MSVYATFPYHRKSLLWSVSILLEEYSLQSCPQLRCQIWFIWIFAFKCYFILILDRHGFWRFFRDDPIFWLHIYDPLHTSDHQFAADYSWSIIPYVNQTNFTILFRSNLRSYLWVERVKDLQCKNNENFLKRFISIKIFFQRK